MVCRRDLGRDWGVDMSKREFIVTGDGSDACESIVDCIAGLLGTRGLGCSCGK